MTRTCVVVATQQEAGPCKPPHLFGEEQASGEILPVTVIAIAGDRHVLIPCQVDHGGQRATRAVVDHPARQVGTRTQAGKRAIEVNIGGVQEFHYQNAGPAAPS